MHSWRSDFCIQILACRMCSCLYIWLFVIRVLHSDPQPHACIAGGWVLGSVSGPHVCVAGGQMFAFGFWPLWLGFLVLILGIAEDWFFGFGFWPITCAAAYTFVFTIRVLRLVFCPLRVQLLAYSALRDWVFALDQILISHVKLDFIWLYF